MGRDEWYDERRVPGEVCMGCSDPHNGVWVRVADCEAASDYITAALADGGARG